MYGDNEVLLGKWFQRTGKRQEVNQPIQNLDEIKDTRKHYLYLADLFNYQVW